MQPISIPHFLLLLLLSLSLSVSVLGTPISAVDLKTTPGLASFNSTCNILCQTDSIMFDYSLAEFLIARSTTTPAHFDWSSDGCTTAPDFPKGYNFQDSCYRHDFGYRNYRNQARLHLGDNRKRIDKKLRNDCNDECTENLGDEKVLKWLQCRKVAELYYVAVRVFGKSKAKPKAEANVGKDNGTGKAG